MYRARSNARYYWLVIIPTSIALAAVGNAALFYLDMADFPEGFLRLLLSLLGFGCTILFPLSVCFFAWTSFKLNKSKFKGFLWSATSVATQLVIALLITFFNLVAAYSIGGEPKFIGETGTEVHDLELGILESKYGIPASDLGSVKHYSEWYFGEEMGRDFILLSSTQQQLKALEAIEFENINVALPRDLSTSNLQFLCDENNTAMRINDESARELLCSHLQSSIRANWNLIQVRQDWTVLFAHFPHSKLIWISEVEW